MPIRNITRDDACGVTRIAYHSYDLRIIVSTAYDFYLWWQKMVGCHSCLGRARNKVCWVAPNFYEPAPGVPSLAILWVNGIGVLTNLGRKNSS
jgi:hypothetical protein